MPDNGRDIVSPLMIGDEDTGPVGGELVGMVEGKAGAKEVQAAQQEEIEDVDAFLVGFIAAEFQRDPLDGVKYQQSEEKEKIKDDGKGVCEELLQFFHFARLGTTAQFLILFFGMQRILIFGSGIKKEPPIHEYLFKDIVVKIKTDVKISESGFIY